MRRKIIVLAGVAGLLAVGGLGTARGQNPARLAEANPLPISDQAPGLVVPPGPVVAPRPLSLPGAVAGIGSVPGMVGTMTSPGIHEDAYQLSTQVEGWTQQMRLRLALANATTLVRDADRTVAASARLSLTAAQRRPVAELVAAFHEFDNTYHQLALGVRGMGPADDWMATRLANIDQNVQFLQAMFAAAPGTSYNRVRVIGMARQMAEISAQLLQEVKGVAAATPSLAPLLRNVLRVQQHAADLLETVQEDAAFTVVLSEHRQWNDALSNMALYGQGSSGIERRVGLVAGQLQQITTALNEELTVTPPVYSMIQQRERIAAGVTQLASLLVDQLTVDLGDDNSGIVFAAQDFADSARGLQLWLQGRATPDITQSVATQSLGAWRRLETQLQRLSCARYPQVMTLGGQLKQQFDNLFDTMRG